MVLREPPDPEKLESHLEGLRQALGRVRERASDATDPGRRRVLAQRIRSYRSEIRDLERDVEKLKDGTLEGTRWEQRPMDDLTRRALIQHFQSLPEPDPDGEAQVTTTPGLPLLIPSVPDGLPPSEKARREAKAWGEIYHRWAVIVAARWKLHADDSELKQALSDRADELGMTSEEVKLREAQAGLLEALASTDEPVEIRVGSGEGSGKVRDEDGNITAVAPGEQGVVGQLYWLKQEAIKRAERRLGEYGTSIEDLRSDEEVDWPTDPETGELRNLEDADLRDDALALEDRDPVEFLADALLAASSQQRQICLAKAPPDTADIVEALTNEPLTEEEMELVEAECESWADVGRLLDIDPRNVDNQMTRLEDKME